MTTDRRPKRHYVFPIILLTLVIFGCGTFAAFVLYTYLVGTLPIFADMVTEFFSIGGSVSFMLIAWIVLTPVFLIVLLMVNLRRRRKLKEIEYYWQDAVRIAVEKEQAKQNKMRKADENYPPRFDTLSSLDKQDRGAYNQYPVVASLSELCDKFRLFAADKLGLYYSESDIREFISGLAVSRIIILQGMSGTGKTSLAYAFGEFIGNPSVIVPVQPMWKERTDLLGYYNEFTKRYNETLLLRKMYEANLQNGIYITVLDEMNIARVEYYFAEFLSLLEIPNPESRNLEVVSDKWATDPLKLSDGRIRLPENMWFIGTVNNDDSTFAISDKVYDRAMVLNLNRKYTHVLQNSDSKATKISLPLTQFETLVRSAQDNYEITMRNERRLIELDNFLIDKFHITFGNRIMKQIRNYIAVYACCGGDELDALDDILAKKVLRKLESQNSAYIRREAQSLKQFLIDLFGAEKMSKCHEYIDRLVRSI